MHQLVWFVSALVAGSSVQPAAKRMLHDICGSRQATITMVFKLATDAEKHWRRLNGSALLPRVMRGERCVDGVFVETA